MEDFSVLLVSNTENRNPVVFTRQQHTLRPEQPLALSQHLIKQPKHAVAFNSSFPRPLGKEMPGTARARTAVSHTAHLINSHSQEKGKLSLEAIVWGHSLNRHVH